MSNTRRIKATVHCRSFHDGTLVKEWDEKRTVYLFQDAPYVSHLGHHRGRKATSNPDGSFTVEYRSSTIKPVPVATLQMRINDLLRRTAVK
jgi:hypothetical protein